MEDRCRLRGRAGRTGWAGWLVAAGLLAGAGGGAAQAPGEGELHTKDAPATFSQRVNLVLVPVTVRDHDGRPVGTLKKDDFQLFDRGKPQVIARFSVEQRGGHGLQSQDASAQGGEQNPTVTAAATAAPDRFVAYLFDDLHTDPGDLIWAREAARKHIEAGFPANERVAIFSTSGQTALDFTDDRAALGATLTKLIPRGTALSGIAQCPNLSEYMADQIENKNNGMVMPAVIKETIACLTLDERKPTSLEIASNHVHATARQVLYSGEHDSRLAIGMLRDAVRRITAMPGQRVLVLVSPGFLVRDSHLDEAAILDRAIRANVFISTLDPRGLTTFMPDITVRSPTMESMNVQQLMQFEADMAQRAILAELADGTGGTFFHNSNDLAGGFERTAEAPEFYYILGFSPQNLRLDGKFHSLKVAVKPPAKMNVTARRGYYAPRELENAAEQARREIEEAVFSREELADLPLELQTQFFKASEDSAKLTVLARLDLRQLRYRRENDRNRDDVAVTAALFDRNGKYVSGLQKVLELRLLDTTLAQKIRGPVTIKLPFDVKPGTYAVRLVARDTEGKLMAAQNGSVDIP